MKLIIGNLLLPTVLALALIGPAHAAHDNGNGKSQDGQNHLDSVSVAPEPSTVWLFLTGALALAAINRRQKKMGGEC